MISKQVLKLMPRHYKILDYAIAGWKPTEIAQEMGMARSQISIVMNSPSFQHQFAIRRREYETVQHEHQSNKIDEVANALKENALAAADKLISGIASPDEKIALKSATELLDRAGYPKEQKVSGDVGAKTQIIVNSVDLNNLKESLDLDSPSLSSSDIADFANEKIAEEVGLPTD